MACSNCIVSRVNGERVVNCIDCGYENTFVTHTMANSICLEREIAKSKRLKK